MPLAATAAPYTYHLAAPPCRFWSRVDTTSEPALSATLRGGKLEKRGAAHNRPTAPRSLPVLTDEPFFLACRTMRRTEGKSILGSKTHTA
jgi:hypothetical protein